MKRFLVIILILVSVTGLVAQVPNLVFSNTYTGTSTTSDYGTSVLDLPNGEVALAGTSGNLNPMPFNALMPTFNNNFIGKFNAVGVPQWYSTIGVATVAQLAKDAAGNIFAVGYVQGTTASINGNTYGSVGSNTLGSQNAFLIKYSPTGTIVWTKIVGSSGNEYGTGVAVDINTGDVYMTGYTGSGAGVYDFEPGVPAATFTCSAKSFLVKLTNNGNYIWHKVTPNGGTNYHGVCTDNVNVYYATQFAGTAVNINQGGPTYNAYSQSNSYDILLMKYRKDGTLINAKTIGGTTNTDYARGIEVKNGMVALFGAVTQGTVSSVNMNGYAEVPSVSLTTNGTTNKDGFISVYDTMMVCQWAKPIGGNTANDETWGGAFDNSGNFIVAGMFAGATTNFNIGGTGTFTASSNGTASDYFYSSYNLSSGNCTWIYKQGGTGADQAADVAVDQVGRIWATGYINNTSTANDMFLNKHFCASTYSVSVSRNSYTGTLSGSTFAFIGCQGQSALYTCSATPATNLKYIFYDMNGVATNTNVYTEPSVAASMALKGYKILVRDSVTNCEQVYDIRYSQINSLNPSLSINAPFGFGPYCPGASVFLQANYPSLTYTWSSGITASTHTVYVTPSVTTTYTIDVYDGSPSNMGCYWSAVATISVAPGGTVTGVPSSTVICSGSSVTFSVNGSATSYTWVSGNNGVISNASSLTITPPSTDSYSLMATVGSCTTTSSFSVVVNICTGIKNTVSENDFLAYPNPASNIVVVKSSVNLNNGTFEMYDLTGRIVLYGAINSNKESIDISGLTKGVYLLKISNSEKNAVIRIIKE